MRPLLIGRDPGGPVAPGELPLTGGPTGRRLAQLCGLDDPAQLADHFELRNLYRSHVEPDNWDKVDAYLRADRMQRLFTEDRAVVLLGRDVQRAFGWFPSPYFKLLRRISTSGVSYLCAACPHPSGLTRFWNDPENVAAGTAFFTEFMEVQ